MSLTASQIASLTIVYSTVYSDADQRVHQSSGSLAFVRGIHRGPVNSPHKGPVTRKMFPFDDVIMFYSLLHESWYGAVKYQIAWKGIINSYKWDVDMQISHCIACMAIKYTLTSSSNFPLCVAFLKNPSCQAWALQWHCMSVMGSQVTGIWIVC